MAQDRGNDPKDARTAQLGAPHGVTLFDHAQIAAEMAEGDRSQAAILEAHRLSESQWNESTLYWMARLGKDVQDHAEHARIPDVYSEAFGRAQDALKPVPEMDPEAYATLVVAVQVAGGPAHPLAARRLSTADFLRLSRHFARRLSTDPEAAERYFQTFQALQSGPEPQS